MDGLHITKQLHFISSGFRRKKNNPSIKIILRENIKVVVLKLKARTGCVLRVLSQIMVF